MEVRFPCPYCGQKLKADQDAIGKRVDCPHCRKELVVPAPMERSATQVPSPGPGFVWDVQQAAWQVAVPPPSPSEPGEPGEVESRIPDPNLEGEHTCPVCWLRFDTGDIMHIAVHDSLRGDPMLGEDALQRFLATRFNNAGQALDAMGLPCSDLACPHCRRKLPPGFLEMRHHIISIVGDKSAGKSYYLTVVTKVLAVTLYRQFGIVFEDSDPTGNAPVNAMRQALFGAQTPEQVDLPHTQFEGAMYERLPRQGRMVALPRPFVYTLHPLDKGQERCALIFYDNAGEHFQPGVNVIEQPGAQHVASAAGIVFLFDPFNSPEFRRKLRETKDPQMETSVVDQQDVILAEMRARILSILNLPVGDRIRTPLAFVVGKCDAWLHLLNGAPLRDPVGTGKIDIAALQENSSRIRELLDQICPAAVANAEALTENLMFFAASSFGHTPVKITTKGRETAYAPDPARLHPSFVELPLLWILSQLRASPIYRPDADGRSTS